MHALEKKIRAAKKQGRIAAIPFITAGFPDRQAFWQNLNELDNAGADIIEIGVPFSDPVADGPVVESASRKSLENGITLAEIMEGLKQQSLNAGIVLMGYANPFFKYGLERLAHDAKNAGVSGLIVPDLPYEECGPFKKMLEEQGIALIPLIGLNTGNERMKLYAKNAKGYVYVVSVMGITGTRQKIAAGVAKTMEDARKIFKVPLALGFGLKHPDQLSELPETALPDAAVFGSALLSFLENGGKAADFIKPWLNAKTA